jgi:hypothetical protein
MFTVAKLDQALTWFFVVFLMVTSGFDLYHSLPFYIP